MGAELDSDGGVLCVSTVRTREVGKVCDRAQCLGAFTELRKADFSFVVSVCTSARNNSAPIGRVFMGFDI